MQPHLESSPRRGDGKNRPSQLPEAPLSGPSPERTSVRSIPEKHSCLTYPRKALLSDQSSKALRCGGRYTTNLKNRQRQKQNLVAPARFTPQQEANSSRQMSVHDSVLPLAMEVPFLSHFGKTQNAWHHSTIHCVANLRNPEKHFCLTNPRKHFGAAVDIRQTSKNQSDAKAKTRIPGQVHPTARS
jgi:hypothetical protein